MNSGHPLEWFVEPIDDYLKCGICGKVLHDPRATLCGHVFCLECIKPWIERFGICPDRCGEVEEDQLRKAVHIEKRISGLLVRCKNYSAGCPIQILLADKRRHEKICRYHYHKSQSFDEVDHRRIYKRLRTSSVPTCTFPSAPVISTSGVSLVYRTNREKCKTEELLRDIIFPTIAAAHKHAVTAHVSVEAHQAQRTSWSDAIVRRQGVNVVHFSVMNSVQLTNAIDTIYLLKVYTIYANAVPECSERINYVQCTN